MTYLLDTDWCVAYLRGSPPAICDFIAHQPPTELAVSRVSIAELQAGVHLVEDQAAAHAELADFLRPLRILELDDDVCHEYGALYAELRALGCLSDPFDMLIAATARRHGLTLCTENVQHFDAVPGLRLLPRP